MSFKLLLTFVLALDFSVLGVLVRNSLKLIAKIEPPRTDSRLVFFIYWRYTMQQIVYRKKKKK